MIADAAAGRRVLLVDDEARIRRFVGISLRAQGYIVLEAADGREALSLFEREGADAIVLDLGLPDMEGLDVLRAVRARSQVPVLVLSVRAAEYEKVRLLDAGANDYMTKPFGLQELSARLRAALRLPIAGEDGRVFDDGRLRVDLARREVTLDGRGVALTRLEWALLARLLQHAGRVVTQAELLRELWGPTHVQDTHYLRILSAKLRAKLGDSAADPRYIGTEPGIGLRFLHGDRIASQDVGAAPADHRPDEGH
jgi:two-component system KDP operon response regulator KdpE